MSRAGAQVAHYQSIQLRVAEALAEIDAAYGLVFKDRDEIVAKAEAGAEFTLLDRLRYRRDMSFAGQLCLRAVERLFPIVGAQGLMNDHPVQRGWRDMRAVSHHFGMTWDIQGSYYGAVALGLPSPDAKISTWNSASSITSTATGCRSSNSTRCGSRSLKPMTAWAFAPITSPSIIRRRSAWRPSPASSFPRWRSAPSGCASGRWSISCRSITRCRLAEEICMLDHMSRGRFELGVGRGVSPVEVGFYGVEPDARAPLFAEALAALRAALTTDRLDFAGEHWNFHDVPMELRPFQQPHPPIWVGVENPEGAERAAHAGFSFITAHPVDAARAIMDAARAAGGAERLMGLARFIVIAEDDETALALARRAYPKWQQSLTHLPRTFGYATRNPRPTDFDAIRNGGRGIAGSPATVAAELKRAAHRERRQLLRRAIRVRRHDAR